MLKRSILSGATAALTCAGALAAGGCLDALDDSDPSDPAIAEHSSAITVTKVVKVCGRRRSMNSPQGWWVDSGIYVTAGSSITIDGRAPGGGIQPWPGGVFWSPAGNPSITDWGDTLGFRSGLTAEGENVAFALVAKVGRDGTAVRIGDLRTFPAPASGTLYLGFNDGVNFEDNLGSWNITVSFPSAISFGTGHGTTLVHADRINTALVDRWGVVLTVNNGNPGLTWTPTYVDNVVSALSAIEPRLGVPLSQIFGGVELRLTGTSEAGLTTRTATTASFIRFGAAMRGSIARQDNRSWGQISPPAALDYYPSGTPYNFATVNDRGIQNTIIHELGHLLEYRTISATNPTSRMRDVGVSFGLLRMKLATSNQDTPADIGTFWEAQVNPTNMTEIVADSFLNWVRNSFVGMIGMIEAPMGPLTPNQQRAAFFWNGGTVGTATSPGWAGTNGFRSTVSNFVTANGIPAFLRGLGGGNPAAKTGGDPDPTCAF